MVTSWPRLREVVRGGQARGTGADGGDLVAAGCCDGRRIRIRMRDVPVSGEPLEEVDADRSVDGVPPALSLTRARADAADGERERVDLLDELRRVAISALRDESDVALNVDARGTRLLARGDAVAAVVREQEFERHPSDGANVLGVRPDLHPFGHLRCRRTGRTASCPRA